LRKKNRLNLADYKKGILAGDRVILSRAITLVESSLSSDNLMSTQLINDLYEHTGKSLRIGITGVPGVGKSTFIEYFGQFLVAAGKKIAVLTVDPSSQKSGGSILGDKTRMDNLSQHKMAYIRPSATGDALGGIAHKTRESMLLCEAAGFEIVIIETVGVGQSETAVKEMVDYFLLLMLAGAGDELQGIKKGIMEMADDIIITKADKQNLNQAKRAKKEYENALHLFPANENGWQPSVTLSSAIEQWGANDIWSLMTKYHAKILENGYFNYNRSQQNVNWMHQTILYYLKSNFYKASVIKDILPTFEQEVSSGNEHAVKAALELLSKYNKS